MASKIEMYTRLSQKQTKKYYNQLLTETLVIVDNYIVKDSSDLWLHIKKQIEDIKCNIVENNFSIDWEDIYDRYDIGRLAIQEFEEGEEIQLRLFDIFGGAVHYNELTDN